MTWVEKLVDKILELQDIIKDPRLNHYKKEGEGNVGVIEIIGKDGGVFKFKVQGGRIIRYDGEDYLTKITMSEDTLLDILTETEDLGEAYAKGHVVFSGRNWVYHSRKFINAFKNMRDLLSYVRGMRGAES